MTKPRRSRCGGSCGPGCGPQRWPPWPPPCIRTLPPCMARPCMLGRRIWPLWPRMPAACRRRASCGRRRGPPRGPGSRRSARPAGAAMLAARIERLNLRIKGSPVRNDSPRACARSVVNRSFTLRRPPLPCRPSAPREALYQFDTARHVFLVEAAGRRAVEIEHADAARRRRGSARPARRGRRRRRRYGRERRGRRRRIAARGVAAAAPQTPLPNGMRMQAGRPWNGPSTSSPPTLR